MFGKSKDPVIKYKIFCFEYRTGYTSTINNISFIWYRLIDQSVHVEDICMFLWQCVLNFASQARVDLLQVSVCLSRHCHIVSIHYSVGACGVLSLEVKYVPASRLKSGPWYLGVCVCVVGGGGGGGPPKKFKKGAQLVGRGPWHAGIAKFVKNEAYVRIVRWIKTFSGKCCVAKDFGNFVFGSITSTSPPFAFRKNSFEGPKCNATLIIDDIQYSMKSCHDEYELRTVPFTISCCKLHFYHPKL
jgi:hypothetical protein